MWSCAGKLLTCWREMVRLTYRVMQEYFFFSLPCSWTAKIILVAVSYHMKLLFKLGNFTINMHCSFLKTNNSVFLHTLRPWFTMSSFRRVTTSGGSFKCAAKQFERPFSAFLFWTNFGKFSCFSSYTSIKKLFYRNCRHQTYCPSAICIFKVSFQSQFFHSNLKLVDITRMCNKIATTPKLLHKIAR